MDLTRTRTRTTLHAVAELLLAGPQYAASGTIRLRVLPAGIGTVAAPDLRLEGTELTGPGGRHPLTGTYAEAAAAIGVEPRSLGDVYRDSVAVRAGDAIDVDTDRLAALLDALARGAAALRAFAPPQEPVLWPEHLDVGISLDEVNYGVSPGDASLPEPYAYVGPWTARQGRFWNQPFGAARPLAALGDVDAIADFFGEGAGRAAVDPPRDVASS
ncbi:MAG TPA: hypothetical protein VFV89_07370 [Nocardioides sp.]|uniref:hypothetical protein n=1 Tax=Nocardioides sp. TaxID=35761 RepID=UPI002E3036A3|nr:hypothetical protein [Nocardioides sp.]HEX5087610.1 hypothetical protein [Nocardioides sp.]